MHSPCRQSAARSTVPPFREGGSVMCPWPRQGDASRAAVESTKVAKYEAVCRQAGSSFCPAVVERFGACGERLAGFIGMISGQGDRDVCDDDFVFSTSSRTTYTATTIVFAAVIADASMLHDVLEHDGHLRALPGSLPPPPSPCARVPGVPGAYAAPSPRRQLFPAAGGHA